MANSQLYVIGSKGSGVLFVKTNPFRTAIVTHAVITEYEKSHPGVDGYARIAAAARSMIAEQDTDPANSLDDVQAQGIEAIVKAGVTLTDADFAFCVTVGDAGWDQNRKGSMPIEHALAMIGPRGASQPNGVPDGVLAEAVLSDKPR